MAKKKKDENESPPSAMPAAPAATPEKEVFYSIERWKGVKDVLKCAKCGTFRDDRDAMIEHILLHYAKSEQAKVFEQLMKENQ